MFKDIKTFCKMINESAAIKHIAMLSTNHTIKEVGIDYDETKGWRSWFVTEQLVSDFNLDEAEEA